MSQGHALFVDEILSVVLEYIPASPLREIQATSEHVPPMDAEASRALARTARVCRALSEPALDVLWRDLYDIEHLLRLLSAFKMKSERRGGQYFCLNGAISDMEWARFVTYARRMQRFEYSRRRFEPAVFERLARLCNGGPLLPSLRELRWRMALPFLTPEMLIFIAPCLRLLTLHGNWRGLSVAYPMDRTASAQTRNTELSLTMIRMLADRALGLEVLSLTHTTSDGAVWEVLPRFPKLNTLLCFGEPYNRHLSSVRPSLHALAAIPSLQSLELVFGYPGLIIPGDSFKSESLEALSLRVDLPRPWMTSLFSAISAPHLRSLSIRSTTYSPRPMSQAGMATIASRFGASLREVYLDFTAVLAVSRCILFETLLPLQQLPQLTAVSLHVSAGSTAYIDGEPAEQTFTDNHIFSMASAWPRLRTLSIVAFNLPLWGSELPSLGCLQAFAQFCPDLRSLDLPIAPTLPIIEHTAGLAALHAHSLEKMSLQLYTYNDFNSEFAATPGEVEAMARTIHRLFSTLNLAMCLSPLWRQWPTLTDPTPWDSVVAAMASLQDSGGREISVYAPHVLDGSDVCVDGDPGNSGADEEWMPLSPFAELPFGGF